MTRDEERLRRFDLAIDLQWSAKAAGFSGLSHDTWRWTERAAIADIEVRRKQRWDFAQRVLAEAREKELANA